MAVMSPYPPPAYIALDISESRSNFTMFPTLWQNQIIINTVFTSSVSCHCPLIFAQS